MVPKDKGWGMSNLVYGGKTHVLLPCCFTTFVVCHLFVSPNLVNLFNAQLVVEELWLRAFIAEVVVVVAGCQPYPLAQSTHVGHSSPSRTLPWSVYTLPRFLVVFSSRTGFWGRFWSHTDSSSSLHEFLSTHDLQIRVLPVSGASTGKNGAAFPHAGPPLSVLFPCWVRLVTHALVFFRLGRT